MDRYPPIAEHGLVGDLQTVALISSKGVLDWFAAPRFDSPSIFAALLDHDRGGYFRLAADGDNVTCRQLYYPDTAVLVTRFMSPDGVGELMDWMPPNTSRQPSERHTLIRGVRAVRGTVSFSLECRPRFDYGRAPHELHADGHSAVFHGPDLSLHLQGTFPFERAGDDVCAKLTLNAGQVAGVVMTVCPSGDPAPPAPTEEGVTEELWSAVGFWQGWVSAANYNGRWQNSVRRSAIVLKLLTYAPTGAPVAAATMGLPEQVGGERNWDYRFTWVRDASLSVRALLDLGFAEEASAFTAWITDRVRERAELPGERLQVMYRVDGDPRLDEEVLDHLEGYRGSYPVRAGNAAMDQLQLDIYGEALYAMCEARELGLVQAGYHSWQGTASVLDWLVHNWDRPDEGIWETRGGRKDFTYSRVMTWVAFDRGIKLAEHFSRPGDIELWRHTRDTVLKQIMDRGWNESEGALVQHYDSGVLDASLLLIPRVGMLAARDPCWLTTLDAMDRKLVSDSLVYRYDPAASPDGLRGCEGTFSLCTFLYVDALARAGRLRQARYAFEKMLTYANHVGLFAEEIGPAGEQLGNFPQAFTHLSLIMAACTLDEALDARRKP